MALHYGAGRVFVVEYNHPICDHERVAVLSHEELKARRLRTDFAISYSSFEHDGLGRYGDPLDPDGDLRAMREAHEALNENGILFLGIPIGTDCVIWNACRVYGRCRLPLMLKGWQCVDVFDIHSHPSTGKLIGNEDVGQVLLVLKRIETDYPDDAELKQRIEAAEQDNEKGFGTESKRLLAEICQLVLDYKADMEYAVGFRFSPQ
jgi:hypothetical protein